MRSGVLSTLLLVFAACGHRTVEARPEETRRPAGSDTFEVRLRGAALRNAGLVVGSARSAVRRTAVAAVGTIEFATSNVARVGPMIEGRVVAIAVEAGRRVNRGDVLGTVQSTEVGRARSEQITAMVRARAAELELTRQQRMADAGVTSGRDLNVALTQRSIAQLEVRASAERLRALGLNSRLASGISTLALTAPIDGTVLQIDARVGQTVDGTDTLFVVGRADTVWLVVDVYERDYARVHQGDEASVELVAYPNRVFRGRVENVGGALDPATRAAPVRIVLDNTDGALRPGMSASARITSPDVAGTQVVVVPRGAVQTIDAQPYVFIELEAGRYEVRPVERVGVVEGDVEIARGLQAGERIVVEGTFLLKSEVLRAQMGEND